MAVRPKTEKWFSFPISFFFFFFHRFSPFNCCVSVVLQLDEGEYSENLQAFFFFSFFFFFFSLLLFVVVVLDDSVLLNLLCVWILLCGNK